MNQSRKNLSLICGIVGLSLAGVSYLIFAFLSIPGVILGIVSLSSYFTDKKSGKETNVAALVCGILAVVLGAIAFVLMIMNVIASIRAASALIVF